VAAAGGRGGGVVARDTGRGVTFVTPVNLPRRFPAKPDLHFTPPALTRATPHQPAVFQAKAHQVVASEPPLVLELLLRTPDGKERRHRMEPDGDGYRVTTAVVPAPDGPTPRRLSVRSAAGSIQGAAVDRPFTLAGKEHRLSNVRRVDGPPKSRVTLLDGTTLDGTPAGLDAVPLRLGPQEVAVNL